MTTDTELVRLPRAFFDDHEMRELPTPDVVKDNKRAVWVRTDDPAIPELASDARHYSTVVASGAMEQAYFGLQQSARATVRALERAGIDVYPARWRGKGPQ